MAISRLQQIGCVTALLLPMMAAGCDNEGPPTDLDMLALLDQYEARRGAQDPTTLIEVELGEFFITRQISVHGHMLYLNVNIFAVIPKDIESDFQQQVTTRRNRMRQQVLTTLQDVDLEHLRDAELRWLKTKLVRVLNEVLETRDIRSVLFTSFTVNQG